MTQHIDNETIEQVAHLARIALSTDERDQMREHFARLLEMVDIIRSVDTDHVAPMSHPGDPVQRLREDEPQNCDHQQALMDLAPQSEDGLFEVPKVVG